MKTVNFKLIRASLLLAWPIALQHILTNLLSMVDVAMVSHLGDTAVGAVGLGNRIQLMILVIALGIAWAVGVLSAQFYGAGKVDRVRNTIALGGIIANIILAPLLMINFFFAEQVIALGSNDEDLIRQGASYLRFTLPSLAVMAFILAYDNSLRALSEVKTPMILSAIAIALNIVLNFWFINGGLGVPALGVTGAAIATSVARVIQLCLIIAYLRNRRHALSFQRADLKRLMDTKAAAHFIKLAAPMTLGFGLWSMGNLTYQLIYGNMGTQELAVMSTVAPIEAMFMALFFGLASACAIVIGQHLGADRFDKAVDCARSFAIFSPVVALIAGAAVLVCKDWILLPFSSLPQATLLSASAVLTLIALMTWIKIINMTIAMGVLRAGGDNVFCTYIDIVGLWLISIPLTALAAFYFELPLILVVVASYSEEIVKAVLFIWRASKKMWMKNLTHVQEIA